MPKPESTPQPTVSPTALENPYRALADGHITINGYEVPNPETGKVMAQHTASQDKWDGFKDNDPRYMAWLSRDQEPLPFSSLEVTHEARPVHGTSNVGRLGVIRAINGALSRGIRQ